MMSHMLDMLHMAESSLELSTILQLLSSFIASNYINNTCIMILVS